MKVSVIGAGGWGTTLAVLLYEKGNEVMLWEYFPDYARVLTETRENIKFLKGIKIPEKIDITIDLQRCVEQAETVVMAVPSHALRQTLEKIQGFDYKKKFFISCIKGIEQKSLMRMSQVMKDVLGKVKFAVISGPSHAEEVSRKIPTAVVAASEKLSMAARAQELFYTDDLRVYTNRDVAGVELGGSVKNVIAIAAGILDGLGAGANTKAALITRGLAEMKRLGKALGAKETTFFGLSGLGDLVVTCESRFSRNRAVGEQLGKGKKLKEILAGMDMVAEGVKTTESVYMMAEKHKVEMPITRETYEVLYKDKPAKQSIRDLMTRKLKSEEEFLNEK